MGIADNEHWLNREGQAISAGRNRSADEADGALLPIERLIEVVWQVSRSMRRHGDLVGVREDDPAYLEDGLAMATQLDLPLAKEVLSAGEGGLERRFFELFDDLVLELRGLRSLP